MLALIETLLFTLVSYLSNVFLFRAQLNPAPYFFVVVYAAVGSVFIWLPDNYKIPLAIFIACTGMFDSWYKLRQLKKGRICTTWLAHFNGLNMAWLVVFLLNKFIE